MKKKLFVIIVVIILTAALAPNTVFAEDDRIIESDTYDISEFGHDSLITINAGLTVVLTNTEDETFTNMRIVCEEGVTLTLDGVKIDNSSNNNACPLSFTGSGNQLILQEESSLKAGEYQPGIRAEAGTTLTISGEGTVTANGGRYSAGIGGGDEDEGGAITIHGGTVNAQGGRSGAGIGGGDGGTGGDITIEGGIINAEGGNYSAGIGGGNGGAGDTIIIKDGAVTAQGGNNGAGIGGGDGGTGGDITIEGGIINAEGGDYGAGIGGGNEGEGGAITIHGGMITAFGGDYGAGIGGGAIGAGGDITVNGGTVTANGGLSGAGIGGGDGRSGGTIIIKDGTVTANGGIYGAGIGGGFFGAGGDITVNGGTVTANGGLSGAGIGGGNDEGGGAITIHGGTVTANGGRSGAGIGGGQWSAGGTIIINSGLVNAQGGDFGAGIGGGDYGAGGDITIEGGIINAEGGDYGAGIGGGEFGAGGAIALSGGIIYAQRGVYAPFDIGHGDIGSGGTLSISGDAAVFLWTNSCINPTTDTHEHETITSVAEDKVYGVPANEWEPEFGVYMRLVTLSYDLNEGTGSVPVSVTQHMSTKTTVGAGEGLLRSTYTFAGGWNTEPDRSGDDYNSGDEFVFEHNTTLYVKWDEINVTSVDISEESLTLTHHDTHQLTVTVLPADATHPEVTWTSSDATVATVDHSGKVTATGVGNAVITVTADGVSDTCDVAVSAKPVTSVIIIGSPSTMEHQDTVALTATVLPANATYPEVTWSSSDTSVLTVSSSGEVEAVGCGKATITATADGQSDARTITVNPSVNGSYDIGKYGNDSNITISTGLEVELTNTTESTFTNMRIVCEEGVTLTLDGVKIDNSSNNNACPLAFTGDGNELILEGESSLKAGSNQPSIKVEEGTTLTISGEGTVHAQGGNGGAGIGGGDGGAGGDITIEGGIINAEGGDYGAGIGGGYIRAGGMIIIKDGVVTAFGGDFGAGIGGGYRGAGGTIIIKDGAVTAQGGLAGAGIGGGVYGVGGDITIESGIINAEGGELGAGIGGGGNGNSGGTINIEGGIVYAQRGDNAPLDIGHGYGISGGTLNISGDAAVFLRTNSCIVPATTTHEHETIISVTGDKVYGVPANGWEPNFGVYMRLITLEYNANSGEGTVPDSTTQHMNTRTTVGQGTDLSRSKYTFGGWNTEADGSGAAAAAGSEFVFTADTTLYAVWHPIRVSSVELSGNSLSLTHHDTAVLAATVLPSDARYPGVTWTSSNANVATVDQSGKVTAVGCGSATITATADGKSAVCEVTVSPKRVRSVTLSENAKTLTRGDVFTLAATVNPSNATYRNVVWTSSNTDVATVDQNGKVTATGNGSVTITATADGQSDTCVVTVQAASTPTPRPTATPTPALTPIPTQTEHTSVPTPTPAQTNDMPDTGGFTEQPVTISPRIIEEDEQTGTLIIDINVSDLPVETTSIQLPNGEIISIGDADTVRIEISEELIDESGNVQIVALNQEGVPLASIELKVATDVIVLSPSADEHSGVWSVLLWVLIGLAGAGLAVGSVYMILRSRKNT